MSPEETSFQKQDRAARLVRILQILGGSPHGVTAKELGERTGRTKRTALRDLEALDEIGIPWFLDGALYKLMPGYQMPTVSFSPPETMAVLLATRLAVQHVDYYNEYLAMAINKLSDTLPKGPVKVYVGESASQLAAKPSDPERQKVFGVITRALIDRKQLRFTYNDAKGQQSERRIHPYFLEPMSLMSRGTYLFGKDIDRKDLRVFKTDRIKEAEVLPTDAYIPDDTKLQKLVADSWGIWTSDKVQKVELRFDESVERRIRETLWHPSQKLSQAKGGGLLMTLHVRGLVEITPWILSWGADVEVLAPPALRKTLAETAQRMAGAYQ